MLSAIEKELAITHSADYFDSPARLLLFKVLANYLSNTNPELNKELNGLTEEVFKDQAQLQIYAKKIIEYMTNVSTQQKVYTTGQLATYFGVSITSINNWISEGRFINLPRKDKNKQARIPENALWKSPVGELIAVREVVEMYNTQSSEQANKDDEYREIKKSIEFFEKKYNGTLENTLVKKEDKTEEEVRDEAEWRYLIWRLKHEDA